MAVALGLQPERALLSDNNYHLINFYRWLKKGLIIRRELENDSDFYYQSRDRFNQLVRENKARTKEAAVLFYYLNRTGFNGLCRFNSSGEFNVPFGRYKKINYTFDFSNYADTLAAWDIAYGDFSNINLCANDFVYADPPYDVDFTSYSKEGFDWNDQIRLAQWLSEHSGPIIASNQATSRILELYKDLGFRIKTVKAPRRISCNGDRTPADEMIATKGF